MVAAVFWIQPGSVAAWDADLELFDLVEEIHSQTFYEFMSVSQVRCRRADLFACERMNV